MPTKTNPLSRRRFLQASAAAASAVALTAFSRDGSSTALASPDTSSLNVPAVGPDASSKFRAVADAVFKAMVAAKVPGVSMGIYSQGRSEFANFGVTNNVTNEMVTGATRFQMGSINKTFTATAVMRLVEAGRLHLDAPVRAYLPELRLEDEYTADHVTIRHLLTHTGGWWGDRFVETGNGDDAMARFVSEELPALPQIAPLGKYVNYNNAAFALLGRVVEVVDGRPFRESLQRLVLDPLDLKSMTVDPSVVYKSSYARGHGPDDAGKQVETTPLMLPRNLDAVGTLWTNIGDLLRYARFHAGDPTVGGDYVLSAKTRADMRTPRATLAGTESMAFGLSWLVIDSPLGRLFEHDGGTFGQAALLVFSPDKAFAMVILTNSQSGAAILGAAQSEAMKQYFMPEGAASASVADEPPLEARRLSESQLLEYTGIYRVPTDRVDLSIVDGRLHFKHSLLDLAGQLKPSNDKVQPEAPIDFVGEDSAVIGGVEDPEQPVTFLRRENGNIAWLAVGSRLFPKVA